MIRSLIDLSCRHRAVVACLVLAGAMLGVWSAFNLPCDALPDTGDRQVIVYSRWNRSPNIIEDQVTYPLVTQMMGLPRVRTVRGISDYGYSWVYVIFEEGTDAHWARARVQEYLASAVQNLPSGVKPNSAPMPMDSAGSSSMSSRIPRVTTTRDNCAPLRTSTFALTCEEFREWPKWRLWAGLSLSIR